MSSSEGEKPHNSRARGVRRKHGRSSSSDSSEFSGFEPESSIPQVGANVVIQNTDANAPEGVEPVDEPIIVAVQKGCKRGSKTDRAKKDKGKSKKASKKAKNTGASINIDTLSAKDLDLLKKKLGLGSSDSSKSNEQSKTKRPLPQPRDSWDIEDESQFIPNYYDDDYYGEDNFGSFDINKQPPLRIEVDPRDISDGEISEGVHPVPNKGMSDKIINAMFGNNKDVDNNDQELNEWAPPKLKSDVRGESISPSLAQLINTTCTSACCIEEIMQKYKIPENCGNLGPPLVNPEVWRILEKKGRSYDRLLVEIQNLVATGIVPIIKMAEVMGSNLSQPAKEYISDAITMFGQVQYQLSLRRRYIIRPNLKKKYKNICSQSTPITSKLFGDDIGREIKNCDTGISLAFSKYENRYFRGRVPAYRGSFQRRGRPHPYPGPTSFQTNNPYQYGGYRAAAPFRGRRRGPSATVTSANAGNFPNE